MELVEMETRKEFNAVHGFLKGAKHSSWTSPGSFAGAKQNEAGKWKWINGEEISYEIDISDLRDSDEESEENELCLMYDHSIKYYTVRECKFITTNVICEKIEIAVPESLPSDEQKFKKLGTYGKKV
jgi:hypothetical protein